MIRKKALLIGLISSLLISPCTIKADATLKDIAKNCMGLTGVGLMAAGLVGACGGLVYTAIAGAKLSALTEDTVGYARTWHSDGTTSTCVIKARKPQEELEKNKDEIHKEMLHALYGLIAAIVLPIVCCPTGFALVDGASSH